MLGDVVGNQEVYVYEGQNRIGFDLGRRSALKYDHGRARRHL